MIFICCRYLELTLRVRYRDGTADEIPQTHLISFLLGSKALKEFSGHGVLEHGDHPLVQALFDIG